MGKFTQATYTNTIKNLTQAAESKLKNPFYKFADKKPIECIYFKQNKEMSTLDEATSTNYEYVGQVSPLRYNMINGFFLYGFDQISLDYDLTDFGLEGSEISGESIILPNTIHPLPGDFFKIVTIKEDVLFKVNRVTTDTLDTGANIYKIEWKLELVGKYEDILKQVVAKYRFIVSNVGTDYSCFITEEQSDLANELTKLLDGMMESFHLYFENATQSYVYYRNGFKMYDPYLIEFLIRTKLMSYSDQYVYVSQAVAPYDSFYYDYDRTFFAMMEDPTRFDIKRATKQAHALLVEDVNSLLTTRLEDYYKIDYRDRPSCVIDKFNVLPMRLMANIRDMKYFEEGDPLELFNIVIAYFSDDTDNITMEMLRKIREADYDGMDETSFYLLPLTMFVLVKYLNSVVQDSITSDAIAL